METVQFAHPMDELKNRLRHILNVIPPHSKIYYIDYPVHGNGGDLLIMKGTEVFFKDHRIHVQARYSVLDFPDGLAIPKDHIIVLHGGGNFGDLYPAHQKLREKSCPIIPVIAWSCFPRRFSTRTKPNSTGRQQYSTVIRTCIYMSAIRCRRKWRRPSSRHAMSICPRTWRISCGRFAARTCRARSCSGFLRTDIEKTAEQERLEASGNGDYLDWSTLFNGVEHKSIRVFGKMLQKGSGKLPLSKFWGKYTDYLVNKAVNRFSDYRTVQTSRLHGHILSCLMDKPNILLDNSYGKNASYYRTWTGGITSAKLMAEPTGK